MCEVEHGHFTPLVFTTTGDMADAADHVYRRLGNLLSKILDLFCGVVMGWIRCKLNFALVSSSVMCFWDAQSWLYSHVFEAPSDVQIVEACLYFYC